MKQTTVLGAFVLVMSAQQASAAPIITFSGGSSTVSGTVIENFDSFATGSSIGTNAFAHTTTSGSAARPGFGSTGSYAAVHTGGNYAISFAPTSQLSFLLGSLDTYNGLVLSFADGTSMTYNGAAITGGGQADGNQTSAATNGVVSYSTGTGPRITAATFLSSGESFEFDNIAVAVPEPATWALMIAGFGLVGATMRRRSFGGALASAA